MTGLSKRYVRLALTVMLAFIFVFPLAAAVPARAERLLMSNYIQTDHSLNSETTIGAAVDIIQTSDGYLWIAGVGGLIRYDGITVKTYHSEDGFPTVNVNCLFEDSFGNLWIATNDSGVVLYRDSAFTVFGTKEGLPSESVRAITECGEGVIYLATAAGTAKITPELEIVTADQENTCSVSRVIGTSSGDVWRVNSDGSVTVMRDDKVVESYHQGYFFGFDITCAFEDSSGNIFMGTMQDKAIVFRKGSENFIVMKTENCVSINSFTQDSEGRVWVCSDSGIGYFDDFRFTFVDGVGIGAFAKKLLQDYEGNYWIAYSNRGVAQFSRSKFVNLGFLYNLPDKTVNAVCEYNGKIFVGTNDGLIVLDKDSESTVHNDITGYLSSVSVQSLFADSAGNLWISTFNRLGLVRYRETPEGTSEDVTYFNSGYSNMPSDQILFVLESASGEIIAATGDGICVIKGDEVIDIPDEDSDMLSAGILSMCEIDGDILIGTDGSGIYTYKNGVISEYGMEQELPSGVILCLEREPSEESAVWISTGNSLCRYSKSDGLKRVSGLDETGSIIDICVNPDGGLWLFFSDKLIFCPREGLLDGSLNGMLHFGKEDGLLSSVSQNSTSTLSDGGTLYAACNEGAFSLDTKNIYKNTAMPKIQVNSVTVDGVEHAGVTELTIPSGAKRITIDFAVLSFASPDNNSAGIMMRKLGLNPESVFEKGTRISYTNLTGGKYVFELTGENSDGIAGEPVIITLHKNLAVSEQPVVIAMLVLVVISLVVLTSGLFYRRKNVKMMKRQAEYREITNQAITAIADTIDAKDPYTSGHSKRVAMYSVEIGKRLGLSEQILENLYYTGLMHDIGKVGLADNILNKPAKLTDDEFNQMKRHVSIGGDIQKSFTVIDNISLGAQYHHERYDGKGYMSGLSGEDIPFFARIICVADAYDAMSTDRPYRKALSDEYILAELKKCAGTHFDEKMALIMIDIIHEGKAPITL